MAKFMKMPGGFLLQIAREKRKQMMQLTQWRLKRTATAAEISQFGNTLSCEKSGSSSSSNSNTPASNTPANGGSATPAQGTVPSNSSVVAWNKQQGGQTWYVVFNGAVYKNAWWVASSNCPVMRKAMMPATHGVMFVPLRQRKSQKPVIHSLVLQHHSLHRM